MSLGMNEMFQLTNMFEPHELKYKLDKNREVSWYYEIGIWVALHLCMWLLTRNLITNVHD
jgi:hypothetical protein